MRCLGIPVVPPVSKILNGRPLNFAGTQTSGWRSRNDSSWKCGNCSRSAKVLIFVRGSKWFFAQPSQNGQPVSGEKCHWTISRRWASSCSCAALMAAWSTDIETLRIHVQFDSSGEDLIREGAFALFPLTLTLREREQRAQRE